MSSRVSAHIRSNVVGYVAVFLALNGVAVAAGLQQDSVRSKQIKDGAIAAVDLGDGSVTAPKVAANSLGGAQIDESTLDPNVLQRRVSGSCSPGELVRAIAADGTVVCAGGGGLPSGSATGDLTGSYPAPTIAPNTIDGAKVSDGSLTGADIGPNALGGAQIDESTLALPTSLPPSGSAAGAGSDLTGSYPAPQIAPGAVTAAKLGPGAVTEAKLAPPSGYIAVPLIAANGTCQAPGWENLHPFANEASYYRDPYGTVHLQGAVLRCFNPPTGDVIFTLPPGYRPGRGEILVGWSSVGAVQVAVDTAGNVGVNADVIANDRWVSLDAIDFSCFPHGVNGCP
jgi:hypothetical protein